MSGSLFEIDTKNTCLLCLQLVGIGRKSEGVINEDNSIDSTITAFRVLLRYLKIDFRKLSGVSASSFHPSCIASSSSSEVNLAVSLCSECLAVINDFFELFQAFESIRLQLDLCVQQLQEFIGKGETDGERVLQFRERVFGEHGEHDLVHANIAEELRREVSKKCSMKLENYIPRIDMSNCKTTPGEEENHFQENGSLDLNLASSTSISDKSEGSEVTIVEVSNFEPEQKPKGSRTWSRNFSKAGRRNKTATSGIGSSSSTKTAPVKCRLCQSKVKDGGYFLLFHLISKHTIPFFADRIPVGVSEQTLDIALASLLRNSAKPLLTLDSGTEESSSSSECPICELGCKTVASLRVHILRRHFEQLIQQIPLENPMPPVSSDSNSRKCSLCGKVLKDKWFLRMHLLQTHSEQVECLENAEEVSKEAAIPVVDLDVDTDMEVNQRREKQPNFSESDENWFEKFARFDKSGDDETDDSRSWKCNLCACGKKEFKERRTFQTHLMSLHPINYFSDRIPPCVSELEVHKAIFYFVNKIKTKVTRTKDGTRRRRRQCSFCERKLESGWKLKIHILRFHFDEMMEEIESEEVNKVSLPITSRKKGVSSGKLFRKGASVDGKFEKTAKGKWRCSDCGLELSNLGSFKQHYYRLHLGIKGKQHQPRMCFDCKKKFGSRYSLDCHRMASHTMDYFSDCLPPSVSELQLETTLMSFVDKAIQAGGNCPFCGKRLSPGSSLRLHFLRRHVRDVIARSRKEISSESISGEKSSTSILQAGYMKRRLHQLRHKGRGDTFSNCEYCGRSFIEYVHLRKHLISEHSYDFLKHRLPEGVSKRDLEEGLASLTRKLEPDHRYSLKCSSCGKGCRHRWHMRLHLLLAHFKEVIEKAVTSSSSTRSADECESALKSREEGEVEESVPVVAFVVDPRFKIESSQVQIGLGAAEDEEIAITEPFLAKVDPEHFETATQNKKVKKNECGICGKVLASAQGRSDHHRRIHLRIACKSESPRKCEFCGKVVTNGNYLRRHKLQVHPIEHLRKDLPSGVTKRQLDASVECILAKMRQLLRAKHGNEGLFECPFCKKRCTVKAQLKMHLLDCHLEKVVQEIGRPRPLILNKRSLTATPKPGSQKCAHCEKYIFGSGGNRRKHLMLEHALILYKDRLPRAISEVDFEKAVDKVQTKFKVLPKGRNEPRAFAECTLCSKRMRKHSNELRFHVLRCHLDEVVKNAEMTQEGKALSPSTRLPSKEGDGGRQEEEEDSDKPEETDTDTTDNESVTSCSSSPRRGIRSRSNYCIPDGVSQQDLDSAVAAMLETMPARNNEDDEFSRKCSLCDKEFLGELTLKAHLLRAHLKQVMERVESTSDGGHDMATTSIVVENNVA